MRLKNILSVAALSFLLTNCVKERGNNFTQQDSASPNIADFPNQSETLGLNIVATPTIYTFYVEVNTAKNSLPAGTSVTIVKSPAVAAAAGYEILPDSTFQLTSATAQVDPVTHQAAFELKLSSSKIQPGHNYAVAYTIASVTNGVQIATNKNTNIINFVVKNQYDGNYHADGFFYHPSSPRPITNRPVTLSTVNGVTVITNLGDLANSIYLTVDASNKVTISDAGTPPGIAPTAILSALPAAYTPFAGSNPTIYNNTYNPTTKTFYLRYGYLGGTGYRVVEEILKKD